MKFWDTEQVRLFLQIARGSKHFPAYFLTLNTGLRRRELLGLRWQDVDLKNGNIKVRQSLVRADGELKFQEPKTKLSKRSISISKEVVDVLKDHRKNQQDEMAEAYKSYNKDNNLVFCNEVGEPYCPRTFTRQFIKMIEMYNKRVDSEREALTDVEKMRKKIPLINFHALRHSFATPCLQQGTDPRTFQEALGHHKVAFTLDIYSGVTERMKQDATEKIGILLASCLE